ncbi:MAG: AMP-dependent synthetase/ligase [Anaerovoracaceae bacterium]|jgi:long-chain acyl-CoA synthetase
MNQDTVKKFFSNRHISSLKDMLNSSVELYKGNTAFLVKKEKGGDYFHIKYSLLKNDVDALGTKLLDMGLKDAKIAIVGENCYEWIATYFSVINGVGVVVPLDKELSKAEMQYFLKTAGCRAVFFTEAYEECFNDFDIEYKFKMKVYGDRTDIRESVLTSPPQDGSVLWEELVDAGEKLLAQGNKTYILATIDPDVMAAILFTSGTTGEAKGVMLSHKNIASNIMDTGSMAYITPEDRTLSILPIHHTFECTMGMLFVIYRGASTAFFEGLKYINSNLAEAQATVLIGVPLIFESIYAKIWKQAEKTRKAGALRKAIKLNKKLKALGIDKSRVLFRSIHEKFGGRLRLVISGAAAIDPNVVRGFDDIGIRMLQGYGLTECSPLVTGTAEYKNTYKKAGSVGIVVNSGELKIIDKDEDGIGEVVFKGPNVMLGYYNMPEETNKVIKDGWFHTGDLGFVDKDGWLYLTGRKKNVIVTKTGKNIYPEEVEYFINKSKYIQESIVHGIVEERTSDTLVSAQVRPDYDVIYEEFGEEFGEEEVQSLIKRVISEINDKLPIYKRIRNFSVRKDEFIKTTTKKIQRHKNVDK